MFSNPYYTSSYPLDYGLSLYVTLIAAAEARSQKASPPIPAGVRYVVRARPNMVIIVREDRAKAAALKDNAPRPSDLC